jgi:uncharacterized membrane protein YkoI
MTRTILIAAFALVFWSAGGCANRDSASSAGASDRESKPVALGVSGTTQARADEAVSFEHCPAAVQDTISAHLNGGAIREIERTTDHGEVLYEVDVLASGRVVEFDVAEDGTFRGYEGDDGDDEGVADDDDDDDGDDDDGDDDDEGEDDGEQEIPLSEVPDHVRQAAMNAVPGLVLEEAAVETEDGAMVYELEGEANGQEYEVEVNEDGQVLEIELDEDEGGDDDDGDDDDGDDDD